MASTIGIPLEIQNEAEAKKALKEVGNGIRQLNAELKTISSSYDKNNKSTADYAKEQEKLGQIIDAQKQKIDVLRQAYEKSKKSSGENSEKTTEWKLKLEAAEQTLQRYEKRLTKSQEELKKLEENSKGAEEATKNLGDSAEEAGNKFNDAQQKLNGVSKALAPLSAAAGAALGGSLKVGADFETSMSKVQAISGAVGEDLAALKEKAKEMGASTSKSASESADALGYMALAGWDTQQMLTGLEPILRASEAGGTDLATTSDLVTDSMSALGVQVQDLEHYLDIVTAAQNNSNTSMQDLLTAYVDCGGTLKSLNVPLEESSALLGTLANRGIKGAEAGTALNSILVNLIGGSESAATAMDTLGVSAWDADGNFIGVAKTLEVLQEALDGATEEQKALFTAAIGGKTQLDTLQALLSGVSEEYDTLNEKMQDVDGTLQATAVIMQDNLGGDITTLKSQLEAVGISIGELITPNIRLLVQGLTEALKAFNDMDEGQKRVIVGIVAFSAAVAPVTKAVSFLIGPIGTLITTTGKFITALKAGQTAMQAFTVACNANPIMLVATAIAAVVAAIAAYELTKPISETEKWREQVKDLNETLDTTRQKVDSQNKAIENEIKTEQAKYEQVEKLIPRLEELNKKTDKSAEEMEEMHDIVDKLNETMPNMKIAIDEETGAIDSNTEAILNNIDALKAQAAAKGVQKQLESTLGARAELQLKMEKEGVTEQSIKDKESEVRKFQKALAGAKARDEKVGAAQIQQNLDKREEEYRELKKTYNEYTSQIKEYDKDIEYYTNKAEEYSKKAQEKAKAAGTTLPSDSTKTANTGNNIETDKEKKEREKAEKEALKEQEKVAKEAQQAQEKAEKEAQKRAEQAAKEQAEAQKKAYNEHLSASEKWVDKRNFKDDWEEIGDSAINSYQRIIDYIQANADKMGIDVEQRKKDIEKYAKLQEEAQKNVYENQYQQIEQYKSEAEFYDVWDKVVISQRQAIKKQKEILEKYYNSGLLSKKDFVEKSKELDRELWNLNKTEQEDLAKSVETQWDNILKAKQQQISDITSKLNDKVKGLENQWAAEDRVQSMSDLQQKAKMYSGAVTLAGQEKYEQVMSQIEQLQREEEKAKLEAENNEIIKQLEEEYRQLEERKTAELEEFKNKSLEEQITTNSLLETIAEKIGAEDNEETLGKLLSGEKNVINNIPNADYSDLYSENRVDNLETRIGSLLAPSFGGIAEALKSVANAVTNITNVNNVSNSNNRKIVTNNYVRDNTDLDILTRSINDLVSF